MAEINPKRDSRGLPFCTESWCDAESLSEAGDLADEACNACCNSERLTDAELDEALAVAQSLNSLRLTAAIAELKERRAEDLTDDDVEVLRYLRDRWSEDENAGGGREWREMHPRTLAVLDKLLAGRSR